MSVESYDWKESVLLRGPCLCGAASTQAHHVVYGQHVRKNGGAMYDVRNGLGLCYSCHRRHHNRTQTIPASMLPESAVEYAYELMGDKARDYLARFYPTKEEQ